MDQVWLAFSLLGLVSGAGILTALAVLGRLAPVRRPPVLFVVAGFVVMGAVGLTGVCLRILGVSRSGLGYRLFNSLGWGYVVFAALYFLLAARRSMKRVVGTWATAVAAVAGLFVFALGFAIGPLGSTRFLAALPPWAPSAVMLAIQGATVALTVLVGLAALFQARRTASRPWRIFYRWLSAAVFFLPGAQLIEYLVNRAAKVMDMPMRDGFVFAVGHAAANLALIAGLVRSLRNDARAPGSLAVPQPLAAAFGLTRREIEIVEEVLEGRSDREIAGRLYISPRTVDTHLRSVFRKCDVPSRTRLAALVARYGEAPRSS